jgi:hypothetical protein
MTVVKMAMLSAGKGRDRLRKITIREFANTSDRGLAQRLAAGPVDPVSRQELSI